MHQYGEQQTANLSSQDDLYRELFENATDIIYIHDLDGRFTAVNKAIERITGYSRAEILKMSLADLAAPEYQELARQITFEALGGGASEPVEFVIRSKAGKRIVLEVTSRLLFQDGRPVGVQGFARDISARRQLEQDRNRVLEMVAKNVELPEVLNELMGMVQRQRPGIAGAVLQRRGDRLYAIAAPDLPPAYFDQVRGTYADRRGGCCGAAVEGRRLEFSSAGELAWLAKLDYKREQQFQYCAAAPILSGAGQVLGALAFYFPAPTTPGPADRELMESTSRLAAIAIEQRQLTDQLAHQAQHDPLTGLPNRLYLRSRLESALEQARMNDSILAVFFIDLDRFKQINDTLGHSTGDMLLQKVGERLQGRLRKADFLARMGGDEFTVLVSELRRAEDAIIVGRKLLNALREPFEIHGTEFVVTASIGISFYPKDGTDTATLLSNADRAMYRAKNLGKNDLECFTPELSGAALERLKLENDLRRALENGELILQYQPQRTLDGMLSGLEVLLVWEHPRHGRIPPNVFIPLAEESGMIVSIGSWVLNHACLQAREWVDAGYPPVKIAVNVSPLQFGRSDLVKTVSGALEASGLDPKLLELELTESVIMHNAEESMERMSRIRTLGVGIAIDDFGTGYSSLSYLRSLPVNTVKIDQSFLREIDAPGGAMALVGTIVSLAHQMGLSVVAEGVESQEQLEMLRGAGCDKGQGNLFGEPVAPERVHELLAQLITME
ncbi:MAG: EAL domain-containing protein [Bryobacteraceae bacterium]|nr:EAL domain-containing protein [Bryobacterales bacterium]NUN01894.1 EAL domain-containing protein [Bryobacteraceae bacterium]